MQCCLMAGVAVEALQQGHTGPLHHCRMLFVLCGYALDDT